MNNSNRQSVKRTRISIIMQARVGSTRLPAKVLKIILGKAVLELDIERCLRVTSIDDVIIATTNEPDAYKIVAVCKKFPSDRVHFYHGAVDDVLARYYKAAREFDSNIIIRITSDCPLFDHTLVDVMIRKFISLRKDGSEVDYLSNNNPPTYPHGLDTEIFTFAALERAFLEAKDPYEREHVTPYIRRHPEIFRIENFSQVRDLSHLRWTLDYPEDFDFIKAVYERLYPQNPAFTTNDVLALLEAHPEIQAINEGRRQR